MDIENPAGTRLMHTVMLKCEGFDRNLANELSKTTEVKEVAWRIPTNIGIWWHLIPKGK